MHSNTGSNRLRRLVLDNDVSDARHRLVTENEQVHQNMFCRRRTLLNAGRNGTVPEKHYLGRMHNICETCSALKFDNENQFHCSHSGKVSLPVLNPYPNELIGLITGTSDVSKNFQEHIRNYNSSFSSLGANLERPAGRGPPCFKICGQLFHRTGCLHPNNGDQPKFSQLYILDSAEALRERVNNPVNVNCREDVMGIINHVILRESPFAAAYKNMATVEMEENERARAENSSFIYYYENGSWI